eukprot:3680391-Pyramimonas_sp.AAC.2
MPSDMRTVTNVNRVCNICTDAHNIHTGAHNIRVDAHSIRTAAHNIRADAPSSTQELALDAVNCVTVDLGNGRKDIDVKKFAKVEKIPGGSIDDCRVLKGVMFAKDVVNPGRMRRRVRANKRTNLPFTPAFGFRCIITCFTGAKQLVVPTQAFRDTLYPTCS